MGDTLRPDGYGFGSGSESGIGHGYGYVIGYGNGHGYGNRYGNGHGYDRWSGSQDIAAGEALAQMLARELPKRAGER